MEDVFLSTSIEGKQIIITGLSSELALASFHAYADKNLIYGTYNTNKIKSIIKLCNVNRFCIDVEILHLAKLMSIPVFEEGIAWNYNKKSTVKLLIDPLNMFIDLIKIRLKKY